MSTTLTRIRHADRAMNRSADLGVALPALDREAGEPRADDELLVEPVAMLQNQPAQATDDECDIGAAIAIVMARFPVTYTKAFAIMLAYSDRTNRSMRDVAGAVLKTYSSQPDTKRGVADLAPPPVTGASAPMGGAQR